MNCDTVLGAPERGEWIVFVKTLDGIEEAKAAGAMIAVDPVDLWCYPGRNNNDTWPEVDLVIVPNSMCRKFYNRIFTNADYLLVPHQWDKRITGTAKQDVFRPGYIGRTFNLNEQLNIDMVTEPDEQLDAMSRFNCHVAEHASIEQQRLKPATKVASAAAVGANIVTHKGSSAVELLGNDYPFYATGTLFDALFKAKKAFGSAAWNYGLEIMADVKEKTSLKSIAERYKVLM